MKAVLTKANVNINREIKKGIYFHVIHSTL